MFKDRIDAGKKLTGALEKYNGEGVVVYALPRGGVVLGAEVARVLHTPLDLVIPRKIGHPLNPEYAICAVTESGELICNEEERATIDKEWLKEAIEKEKREAKRRRETYLGLGKPNLRVYETLRLKGKTAIIVDDGVATGLTIRAAIKDIRVKNPKKLVVAVPVVPKDVAEILRKESDELVALEIPEHYLGAVGAYYCGFGQVEDEEVIKLLSRSTK